MPTKRKGKTETLKLRPDHRWKAKPGCEILVADRGAVRFDIPEDRTLEKGDDSVRFHDREPPDDDCLLQMTLMTLPAEVDWSAFPLDRLLVEAMEGDSRGIVSNGPVPYERRPAVGRPEGNPRGRGPRRPRRRRRRKLGPFAPGLRRHPGGQNRQPAAEASVGEGDGDTDRRGDGQECVPYGGSPAEEGARWSAGEYPPLARRCGVGGRVYGTRATKRGAPARLPGRLLSRLQGPRNYVV
jgi:hypothetical protein